MKRKMPNPTKKSSTLVVRAAAKSGLRKRRRSMNAGLVDEIRLVVQPLVLGAGKPLFKDVKDRHPLTLVGTSPLKGGAVSLNYKVAHGPRN